MLIRDVVFAGNKVLMYAEMKEIDGIIGTFTVFQLGVKIYAYVYLSLCQPFNCRTQVPTHK